MRPARLVIALLLFGASCEAMAQVPRPRRRANVSAQLRWVQFSLIAGRIEASSQQFGRSMTSQSSGEGRQETLSISLADGVPVVHYELSTNTELTTIHVSNRNAVEVQRQPRGDSTDPRLEFTQLPRRQLMLAIGAGEDRRVIQGETLWHLLLADPVAAGEQLAPLLELLNPDWKLAEQAAAVQARLLDPAVPSRAANQALWTDLIAELGSDSFARRRAADRKLRDMGPGLLPHLQLLDRSRLDAEQRIRIQRIVEAATTGLTDGSPRDLADWLAWDPRVWLTLMERDDPAIRQTAATRLSSLLGRTIPFDPTADAATRQSQLQTLRHAIIPAGT
jgi:hypothetical protein